MSALAQSPGLRRVPVIALAIVALGALIGSGCGNPHPSAARAPCVDPQRVVVVAPVLNLSGSPDLDPLKVTDLLASEVVALGCANVVPVNLALAALARRGKTCVETPGDALGLARELGADGTLVAAVTEYDPYEPPVIGLIMQWYAVPGTAVRVGEDGAGPALELSASESHAPRIQVQRVFDAAQEDVLDEIRGYAAHRPGYQSPHGWRRICQSQELYVRFSLSALLMTIRHCPEFSPAGPTEVKP